MEGLAGTALPLDGFQPQCVGLGAGLPRVRLFPFVGTGEKC